jgi:hypothetical protein
MGQSTKRFAASKHVKPQSIISRLCRTGSYFGVRPQKLENGRWDWPDESSEPKPDIGVSVAGERSAS